MSVTPTTAPTSLYASREKIQARHVRGRYARLRVIAAVLLLGVFYLLPWLSWDGRPLVLLDLPARRFHLFGLTLVPQDLFLLTGVLVLAAMTLFLFTTLAGRLWCGYACPQTVWTEIFMAIERWVEGDRHQRLKLDAAPWSWRKLRLRGSKHVLWLLLAFWTGLSFVGFFVPIQELLGNVLTGHLAGWSLFWICFYGFATWGNAGFLREQVCQYMCPYARFQGAMFDPDTLIIAYDELRGEPRKTVARQHGAEPGACVDCSLCVQVCPTGIDIRDGLQYQCIACAACVDACNSVMDHTGQDRGLVRYTSSRFSEEGRFRILRPRLIGYAMAWLIVAIAVSAALFNRGSLEMDLIRDRHALVRTVAGGLAENIYTVKLTNKTGAARTVVLRAADEQGRPVPLNQAQWRLAPFATSAQVIAVRAQTPPGQRTMGLVFQAHWHDESETLAQAPARFIGASP